MHFTQAVAIVIPSVVALTVTHAFMPVAPLYQAAVAVVCIGVDARAWRHRGLDEGLDDLLLNVGQHPNDDIATTLDHSENRRLLACECPTPAFAFESSTPAEAPCFTTSSLHNGAFATPVCRSQLIFTLSFCI
jgi:hypothetical protein